MTTDYLSWPQTWSYKYYAKTERGILKSKDSLKNYSVGFHSWSDTYCSGPWASHLRPLWKPEKWGELCFFVFCFCGCLYELYIFGDKGRVFNFLTVNFANYSDLTNNGLGNCEAEKGEEEHNYDYVDENTIENLRQIFQGTTVRNKHASSEGRRWVWPVIIYKCKQVWAEWFFRLAGDLHSLKWGRFSLGRCHCCSKCSVSNMGRAPLSWCLWPSVILGDVTFVKVAPMIVLVTEVHMQDQVCRWKQSLN